MEKLIENLSELKELLKLREISRKYLLKYSVARFNEYQDDFKYWKLITELLNSRIKRLNTEIDIRLKNMN